MQQWKDEIPKLYENEKEIEEQAAAVKRNVQSLVEKMIGAIEVEKQEIFDDVDIWKELESVLQHGETRLNSEWEW